MIKEEAELTTSAIKMQTLLHQFIQLYDRITVEHSLMTDRELKIVKNLEALNQTIINLEQTTVMLDELGQQIKENVKEVIRAEVNNGLGEISNRNATSMDSKVSEICRKLNNEHNHMRYMVNEYEQIKRGFNLKLWIIALLLGFSIGLGGSYWYLKKFIVIDWNAWKSQHNINRKK